MKPEARTASLIAAVATTLLAAGAVPAARADDASDRWSFLGTIYAYTPDIDGSAAFPSGAGTDIHVDADTLIRNTDLVFMGAFETRKGRWGALADLIYLDLGDSVNDTRQLSIGGGIPLPGDVTADLSLDVEARIWTLAGTWRALSTRRLSVDVIAGARFLDLEGTLGWEFSGDVGPFAGPARAGSAASQLDGWDGIVGTEGRIAFGSKRAWFARWYLDAGTGDADSTWQAIAGVGRSFAWGDVVGAWRHLDYDFESDEKLESLDFSGPALGVAFRF